MKFPPYIQGDNGHLKLADVARTSNTSCLFTRRHIVTRFRAGSGKEAVLRLRDVTDARFDSGSQMVE